MERVRRGAARARQCVARIGATLVSAPLVLLAFCVGAVARVLATRKLPAAAASGAVRRSPLDRFSNACVLCSAAILSAARSVDRFGDRCGQSQLDAARVHGGSGGGGGSGGKSGASGGGDGALGLLPLPDVATASSVLTRGAVVVQLRREYEWAVSHGAVCFSHLQVAMHMRYAGSTSSAESAPQWVRCVVVNAGASDAAGAQHVMLHIDAKGDLYTGPLSHAKSDVDARATGGAAACR